ncbi:short-chain collagen C4-like [Ruditapes philippinarum]|uniref:short-chain collagen C4-like n=1 Tax=Ruditapes philippinarum TaxID=129788 RepID=UPI00295BD998|nr:short-chain collagen C4-like [Ruditapes philippinarum]
MLYSFALCLILNGVFGEVQNNEQKRLLLHSDTDIATEILTLKSQFNAQASEIKAQASEIKAQASEIKAQTSEINSLKQQLHAYENSGKGSSYVRWGRTICPGNGSSVFYKGFMSGTFIPNHQSGGGSGANFLCLPENPLWDHYTNTKDNGISITGVEYTFSPHTSVADQVQFFGSALGYSEAPCVTCHINRGSNIMIPGRTECFGGWTKEYSGYLVAGYPGYGDSTEYVCLDRRPEVVAHSGNADAENNLYFVESHCGGTLACPPYVDGRELSCVVCSI